MAADLRGMKLALRNLSIDDNEWHHVSVASDPIRSEVRFELDGVLDHILFSSPPTNPNSHDFVVGGHSAESGGWNQGLRGVYDEAHEGDGMLAVGRRAQLRQLGPACAQVGLEHLLRLFVTFDFFEVVVTVWFSFLLGKPPAQLLFGHCLLMEV